MCAWIRPPYVHVACAMRVAHVAYLCGLLITSMVMILFWIMDVRQLVNNDKALTI